MHRRSSYLFAAALLLTASACEAVDRVRDRVVQTDSAAVSASAEGLTLGLQTPGVLRSGEEGLIRLSLTNRGDTVPRGVRLDLLVPGWMEPMPPRPGDREVTLTASAEEGTRFSYPMDEPPLQPGEVQIVEQRIRVPLGAAVSGGATPWNNVVRARLVGPGGEPLAQVESEISVEDAAPADSARTARTAQPGGERDRVGPVRLGMTVASLRRAVPAIRDTSWTNEGMRERGLVVPVAGGGRAVALLSGDTILRVEVTDSLPRTREGLGVGSRLEELRAAYGRSCGGAGEGDVVVWFANAPGISFALDVPFQAGAAQVRADPEGLAGSARVTRWWLRRGTVGCP